ncbi:MAG TPA: LuxR C-terminal-related transcriptional regulator, partial [Candidatus Binatia bacterium]|nr:LuxR C-terminal-related transcriptional regulator [Candidatus Binatia bacterium]
DGAGVAASSRAYAALATAEWTRLQDEPEPAAWDAAAAAFERIPEPLREGYARYRQAEAILAAKGRRADAAGALSVAARLATDLGAEPLSAAVATLARRARLDITVDEAVPAEGGQTTPDPAASLGLTPRELEILAIVARGRTNHQIAEELFITDKTVGVHMTNILAKLGVTNRIDAAAIADRLGIGRGRPGSGRISAVGGSDPGDPPAAATSARHPRLRRAFLFTDIVGSTALIGVIGDDAWIDLRRWHDARLRAIFSARHGEELDHAGDGFLVAFERTGDAIDCAIDIQRALADHRRHEGFAPSVRIGIHVSEAVREGSGFAGRAIHEGARIVALAGADEIVASMDAVRDAPPRKPPVVPRTVALKGFEEPVVVATIPWQGG